jgi:hypothetical protein
MIRVKIPWEQLEEVLARDDNIGFCLACGCEQHGIEPDREQSKCVNCDDLEVYAAEQILIMGYYKE